VTLDFVIRVGSFIIANPPNFEFFINIYFDRDQREEKFGGRRQCKGSASISSAVRREGPAHCVIGKDAEHKSIGKDAMRRHGIQG
jgi:hypothetical protein